MRSDEARLDPWIALAFAVYAGGLAVVAPGPTGIGLAAATGVALARRALGAGLACVLATGCALATLRGRAAMVEGEAVVARALQAATPPGLCELYATIVRSPVEQRGLRVATARIDSGACEGRPLPVGDRVRLVGLPAEVVRGDALEVVAELGALQRFANEGTGDRGLGVARGEPALSGRVLDVAAIVPGGSLGGAVDRLRDHVRARIFATYHADAQALGRALVIGEGDIDEPTSRAFRETGLAHVLAVSGTHLVVAALSVLAALRTLLVHVPAIAARFDVERPIAALGIPLVLAYADFTGRSGSVMRAAWMLSAALLARALGRRPHAPRSVAASILAGAVADPLVALDASFALSLASTAGLLVLARPLARVLGADGPPATSALGRAWVGLARSMSTTLAATLACGPVTLCLGPSLPVLGVLVNLVAAPLGELIALPVALAHGLLAPLPLVERGAALVASGALRAVALAAHRAASTGLVLALPPPTAWQLAFLPALALGAWAASTRKARLGWACVALVVLVALELGARARGAPRGLLRVSALDVGQGDALLVDLPDGSLLLIDGGGIPASDLDVGERVLLPALRARRRERVDVMLLTHPHPDHYGGLGAVAAALPVGEFWHSGAEASPGGPVHRLLTGMSDRGAILKNPGDLCGNPRSFGGATVEVLAPCPRVDPALGANDGSLVVRIAYGAHAALLVGDAEHEAEARLVGAGLPRATLLKVGHHGSATSTGEALLAAVAPSFAIVSCGARNRFGHPHPTTLAALEAHGIDLARTDRSGEVRFVTDGARAWLER